MNSYAKRVDEKRSGEFCRGSREVLDVDENATVKEVMEIATVGEGN